MLISHNYVIILIVAMATCLSKADWFAIDRSLVINITWPNSLVVHRSGCLRSRRCFCRFFNRCYEPEVRQLDDQLTSFVTDLETAAPPAPLVVLLVGRRRQSRESRVTARRRPSKVSNDDWSEWRGRWWQRPSFNVRVDLNGRTRNSSSDQRG